MFFAFTLSLRTADPFIGKIDKHSLSQQTLVELFAENITNREQICCSPENPKHISDWKGLTFNESHEIVEINWTFLHLQGSIELKWLPCALKECYLNVNSLQGTIDLTCLPEGFYLLSLEGNTFEGTVDLTKLPASLEYLNISENKLTGQTDFNQLPKAMRFLDVSFTNLEGEINSFDGEFCGEKCKVVDMRKG